MSHPGVADCGVVGIPDVTAGELPHAWVVPKPDVKVTEKEIVDFVESTHMFPYIRLLNCKY